MANSADEQLISKLAQTHQLSRAAVATLAESIRHGRGMAQFSHPDLGGMGQWSPGMTMVGDMSNDALKSKVDAVCTELAEGLSQQAVAEESPGNASIISKGNTKRTWYPSGLGDPSSVGEQNGLRYAAFPSSHRLVIEDAGEITIYDTGDHVISGAGQSQGSEQSMTFTSQFGVVRVADLPRVEK